MLERINFYDGGVVTLAKNLSDQAKKRITLTKEILADILEKNPNKTLSQVVEILNKGTPSIKYVTPGLDKGNEPNLDEIKKTIKLVNQLGYQGAAKKLKKIILLFTLFTINIKMGYQKKNHLQQVKNLLILD